ncbi:MAG: hypothetical protein CMO81_01805 [Waddliaceae bacterium]|nr:hypothetical protein [Waddliaceae bacterium]
MSWKTRSLAVIMTIILCYAFVSYQFPSNKSTKIRLGINPWPGYELLVVAEQLGYFEEFGVDIELVDIGSLADIRRAFDRKQINAMTCTLSEVVQTGLLAERPSHIIMVSDFSIGGDVILAKEEIKSVKDLKGKRVGIEAASLGGYIIYRALELNNLNINDVELVSVDQPYGASFMKEGKIDAQVTYSPYDQEIMNTLKVNEIFSSMEIPGEVVDIIAVSPEIAKNSPKSIKGFLRAWEKAYNLMQRDPDTVHAIMAQHLGIQIDELRDALKGVKILNLQMQKDLFKTDTIEKALERVEEIARIEQNTNYIPKTVVIDKSFILNLE